MSQNLTRTRQGSESFVDLGKLKHKQVFYFMVLCPPLVTEKLQVFLKLRHLD